MSSAGDQLARLLALVPWLRAHPGVSPQDAADEFGISLAQLEADLNLLIVCGVPGGQHGDLFDIEFWADDEGASDGETDDDDGRVRLGTSITVHDAQTLERPMRLRPDEAVTLLLGLHLLQQLPGRFDRDRLNRLAVRLEAVAGDALTAMDGALRIDPADGIDEQVLSAIETALATSRQLHLEYLVPARDEVTRRRVDPQRAALIDGQRYLVAWCHTAQAQRHFRVDRVMQARVLEQPIQAIPTAEPGDQRRPAYEAADDAIRVTLDLEPAARWICEFAVIDRVEELTGGKVQAQLTTASMDWAVQLVMRAAGGAAVVSPPELAEAVLRCADTALAAQRRRSPAAVTA